MFKFFTENNLILQNRSGFKPGDSCTNQLLSITHQIYKSFDDGHDVRSVFLDMSKAFDKVWHKGLIFKLKQNGISSNLLKLVSAIFYQMFIFSSNDRPSKTKKNVFYFI